MSSDRSRVHRPDHPARDRVGICLIRVGIEFPDHASSEVDVRGAESIVCSAFTTIVEYRGGKPLHWRRDGGDFMFLVESGDGFDNCCTAALQMLDMTPSINEDIRSMVESCHSVTIRIFCDTGTIDNDFQTVHCGSDLSQAIDSDISCGRHVTITGPVYKSLSSHLQSQFAKWKFSTGLNAALYRKALTEEGRPLNGYDDDQSLEPTPDTRFYRRNEPAEDARENRVAEPQSTAPPRSVKAMHLLTGLAAAAILLAGLLLGWGLSTSLSAKPELEVAEAPATAQWNQWRGRIHEKLSQPKLTEEQILAALNDLPEGKPETPAAHLRRHQAIADVFKSYKAVDNFLYDRFGIDEQFLGTGFSKPVNVADYSAALVHEYWIRNHPDNHPQIWWRSFKNFTLTLDMPVKEIVESSEPTELHEKQLKQAIIQRVETADSAQPAVIRFSRLNEIDYSRKLGKPVRACVFASNLSEVWNLKVKDAAHRSGYIFSPGDTFYVWVFVPTHSHEVVPATWGELFDHASTWMESAAPLKNP